MSALKCPNPGCGETEAFAVRPVYEFARVFRWWQFWRGVHLVRIRVGEAILCARCDLGSVHTDTESFLTQKSYATLGVPDRARPAAEPPARPATYRPVALVP